VPMTTEDPQIETGEGLLAPFDLLEGTSESTRGKTAETFLELLGARVRNPNTRGAYRVAWRSFLAFCSARGLELESVKAYHVGAWLDQHPGSRSTQRQHLAAVRLLFAIISAYQAEAGGAAHLQDSQPLTSSILYQSVAAFHDPTDGIANVERDPAASQSVVNGFSCSFAAVSHRKTFDLQGFIHWPALAPAFG
jgi:hypothetical protein